MVLNRSCCDPVLKALAFSLLPPTDKSDFTVGKIKNILTTFSTTVQITTQENDVEAVGMICLLFFFFAHLVNVWLFVSVCACSGKFVFSLAATEPIYSIITLNFLQLQVTVIN